MLRDCGASGLDLRLSPGLVEVYALRDQEQPTVEPAGAHSGTIRCKQVNEGLPPLLQSVLS